VTLASLVLALVFGAVDQYIGSLSAHPIGADVSGLSAPWLLLPFVVGALQRSPRRAAALGLGSTLLALIGYMVMTFSPIENAHLTLDGLIGFLRGGNIRWFVAGVATGPLFALFGYHWRNRRVVLAGLTVGAVLCLEPWARRAYGNSIRSSLVTTTEIAVGLALAFAVLVRASIDHRRDRTVG
jgi:uncharacterized membrane protein (UPF0136 family)